MLARIRSTFFLFFTLFAFVKPAQAATPRDELLRLVPDDVGFCLVVQNLRDHLTALENSPFMKSFRQSGVGASLRNAPETAIVGELLKQLETHFHLTWAELC